MKTPSLPNFCRYWTRGDKMADHADIAGDIVEVCTAEAEARARGHSRPETHPDFDGSHCVECETEIPAPRLAIGKVRCVFCQRNLEKRLELAQHNVRV